MEPHSTRDAHNRKLIIDKNLTTTTLTDQGQITSGVITPINPIVGLGSTNKIKEGYDVEDAGR